MTMLVLDLKTVPDAAIGKRLLALERFSDAEAELAMRTLRVAGREAAAAPVHQRRVVAATLVVARAGDFMVEELAVGSDESLMLAALEHRVQGIGATVHAWDSAQSYRPQLLGRALATGLTLPGLLRDHGPLSLAALAGLPAEAPLHEFAAVHGLPHRLGLRAADAEAAHGQRDGARLVAGCAADALIAYLLSLALRAATGELSAAAVGQAREQVRDWLGRQTAPHWQAFQAGWLRK